MPFILVYSKEGAVLFFANYKFNLINLTLMICIYQPISLMTFFILCCHYNGDTKSKRADWQLKFYVFINAQFNTIMDVCINAANFYATPLGHKLFP